MIIKFTLGIILSIAIGLAIMALLILITKKKAGKGAIGGLIGFFLAFAIFLLALLVPKRLYVVNGENQYNHYMIWGTPDYALPDGQSISVDMPYDNCLVVNESEETVVIEEIKYGGYGFSGDTEQIAPGKFKMIGVHKVSYFFSDDEPPEEITVNDGTEEEVRIWLRMIRR